MKARSLARRLMVLQQATALAVTVAFTCSSLLLTSRVLRARQVDFLVETTDQLARAFDDELKEMRNPVEAAAVVIREGTPPGVLVDLYDTSGRLLATSGRTPVRARRPGDADSTRAARRHSRRMLATARSASGVTVRASMSEAFLRSSLSALSWSLLVSALPLLLVSFVLSWGISRRALRPLSAMADRAERVSVEQGLGPLGDPSGLQEIDRLAGSFNRLLGRLDHALRIERRFTADASHELRTPLTALSGELEMASERADGDRLLAAGLMRASDQVRGMRELVEAILLLHRSGEISRDESFEVVNLSDLAREASTEVLMRYGGRTADVTVVAPDEVLVPGRPVLLASGLRNLMDNALKFTRLGDAVRLSVSERGDTGLVVVEDGGPGIPEAERDRVFDSFFRGAEARAAGSGFGLGLPILRRVTRAHGGDVSVGPSSLGGARFEMRLPLWNAAEGAGRSAPGREALDP